MGDRHGRQRRNSQWVLVGLGVALLGSVGCGNAIYVMQVNSASTRLEEAREIGAEQLAPYDYYYAEEHLKKARQEAAEADYGDAIKLASAAEEHAAKAVKLAREAKGGEGR
jgi:hypothetical protein